jgi:hypothetical protein
MLHGEASDILFEDAAQKYLSPFLFDEFRFVKSGRAGTLEEFLDGAFYLKFA